MSCSERRRSVQGSSCRAEIDAHQGSEAGPMELRPKRFVETRHGYSIQSEGRASKGA